VTDELKAKLQPASQRLMDIERERTERRKVRGRVNKNPEGDDLEDESVYRKKELEELEALISPDVKADIGANPTGWYELIGECEPPWVLNGNRPWALALPSKFRLSEGLASHARLSFPFGALQFSHPQRPRPLTMNGQRSSRIKVPIRWAVTAPHTSRRALFQRPVKPLDPTE
jgi:hypothetical protein